MAQGAQLNLEPTPPQSISLIGAITGGGVHSDVHVRGTIPNAMAPTRCHATLASTMNQEGGDEEEATIEFIMKTEYTNIYLRQSEAKSNPQGTLRIVMQSPLGPKVYPKSGRAFRARGGVLGC
jgi:hypothetical protein